MFWFLQKPTNTSQFEDKYFIESVASYYAKLTIIQLFQSYIQSMAILYNLYVLSVNV